MELLLPAVVNLLQSVKIHSSEVPMLSGSDRGDSTAACVERAVRFPNSFSLTDCDNAAKRFKSARAYDYGLDMRHHCQGPNFWRRHSKS